MKVDMWGSGDPFSRPDLGITHWIGSFWGLGIWCRTLDRALDRAILEVGDLVSGTGSGTGSGHFGGWGFGIGHWIGPFWRLGIWYRACLQGWGFGIGPIPKPGYEHVCISSLP